jgi:hypothetical protein
MDPKTLIPLIGGSSSFRQVWVEQCTDMQRKNDEWVTALRNQGIKAAHPDDGWVDREKNRVQFSYPQFNDGADVGDVIALGYDWKWRLVRLTAHYENPFGQHSWSFEPYRSPD